jgi:hypothetical protein
MPDQALLAVLTIQEAAELFGYSPKTIMYRITEGHIAWRKVGGERRGLYLVSLDSLIRLYGQPLKKIPENLVASPLMIPAQVN